MSHSGRRLVLALYVTLVAFTALVGVLFSTVVENPDPPALFFLVELPPSALGFALYGGLTVGLVLGVPLLLVVYVSGRLDTAEPRA